MPQRRRIGFPAEATDSQLLLAGIPDNIDPSGNAIAVKIIGIGEASQCGLRHRFEQPQANDWARHPR